MANTKSRWFLKLLLCSPDLDVKLIILNTVKKLDPSKRIFGLGVRGSMVVPTAMLYMSGKEAFCLWSNFFISLSFQIPLLSNADIIRIVNYIFFSSFFMILRHT